MYCIHVQNKVEIKLSQPKLVIQ